MKSLMNIKTTVMSGIIVIIQGNIEGLLRVSAM